MDYYKLGSLHMGKIVKISLNPLMEVEGNLIDMDQKCYILTNGKRKKDRERELAEFSFSFSEFNLTSNLLLICSKDKWIPKNLQNPRD